MQADKHIIIIGAGLVGSLFSIYLAKRGFTVDVYERRKDMRKEKMMGGRSINLALSERGWLALEKVGIRKEIEKVAIAMKGRMVHNTDGSQVLQPYGKEGQAIYSVSRGGLNSTLLDCAEVNENVRLHFNYKCEDVDLKNKRITFLDEDKRQKEISYNVLFGTDGAYSAVRNALQKMDSFEYSESYIEHGYKELTIPAADNGGWQMEKHALHIWPRKNFMLIALPNLDGSFTCTLFFQFEGEESFSTLKTKSDVERFFGKYFPEIISLIPDYTEGYFHNPTSSLITVKCYPWSYEDSACLLGDAAHAIVPFFGQGMNCGFEDCRLFDEMMNKHSNWQTLFKAFEQKRKPDADAIAELALNNFIEMRDLVADPHFLKKKKIEKRISELFPDSFISAYSMVSFNHIPYSEALRRGILQNAVLESLASEENISDDKISEEFKKNLQ
jgi:kynurenine 3-monooxygenase